MSDGIFRNDSHRRAGGHIPGTLGWPAFWQWQRGASDLPILIAVPHAGRAYSSSLLRALRHPVKAALKLEDRHADAIGRAVAKETGAALLVAEAPRAMIDLNRAPDDVDWEMVARAERAEESTAAPGERARSGLGLVPRRVPGMGELWKSRLALAELEQRIDTIHVAYHAALRSAMETLRQRWGAALLIDLHSMPPIQPRGSAGAADLVIGDRFGASCDGSLVAEAFACLGAQGWSAAHNRPYAGGYVLERHGRPAAGLHAIQLEIDRSLYLDAALAEPGAGFDRTVAMLCALVRRLAPVVADLADRPAGALWSEAAE